MKSGEPTSLSANNMLSDSIHRSTLTTFLDRFVNNDDDGDAPIFEGSFKDSSSHHVRGLGLLTLGWQGSCRSFAGLDCSDHSTGSFFNVYDKADQRRGVGSTPKNLLDCFAKTSTELTVFSENDDESENQEIKETNKTKADLESRTISARESREPIRVKRLDSKKISKSKSDNGKTGCPKNVSNCTITNDCRTQSNRQKQKRTEDYSRTNSKGFSKQVRNGFSRARPRTKITSRAKSMNTSTFVYEPLSGKSLVTDNMESCSSLSFGDLNDDDLMGSLTRMVLHLSDSYHSPTKDPDTRHSPKTRSPLKDCSRVTRMALHLSDSYHSPTKDTADPRRSPKTRSPLKDCSKDTRMPLRLSDSYHSPTKEPADPRRSPKARSPLKDCSKDTIPRVPSRSQSPKRA